MARSCHAPHDTGPEFKRRLEHDVCSFARRFAEIAHAASSCRDAAELVQAECDRLLAEEDAQ